MMQKFFKQKNKACPAKLKRSRGFTLIETLVAVSIFTMSILGLLSILASGISNTNYAKQKVAAIYLAQEGIEYARNKRDTSVLSGTNAQAGWERFRDDGLDLNPLSALPAGFTREVLKTGTGDEVEITSIVTVSQASGAYTITLSENLFNWVE